MVSSATTTNPIVSSSSSGSGGAGGGGASVTVDTDKGPIEGAIVGESRVFLGVPFAAPPVGNLRWKPPQPHAAWTEPLDATMRGPKCPQLNPISPQFDATSNEDCLTLNVWAPKEQPTTPVPVLVWIHGGTYIIGSGGDPAYDGQKLAEATGSVVITINYRLGPLGFLTHDVLEAEDAAHPSSGMYAIEDQRAALAWTRDNVAAFGGDPLNVTIFGESAGASSVCMHLLSTPSQGLYHQAILQSGVCAFGAEATVAQANARGASLITALGCDGADPIGCMRGKTAEEILMAQPVGATEITSPNGWGTHVDGLNLPGQPSALLAAGDVADVPVMLGSNANEGSLFFAFADVVPDEAAYLALAEAAFPGNGAAVVAQYPSATYGSPEAAAAAAVGDAAFVCSARRMARWLSAAGTPTFLYHFTHAPTETIVPDLGAFHSAEIAYVFGVPQLIAPDSPTPAEAPLVAAMQGYWGRMAATGDPNGDGAFLWPQYDVASDENIVLDLELTITSDLKEAQCDFFDSL
ncbi:MAG: carboxylesterase family protein [Polyangiaceae bacterium]|nr:carboxylesterase family protein [Polyangiaceae bacterium]